MARCAWVINGEFEEVEASLLMAVLRAMADHHPGDVMSVTIIDPSTSLAEADRLAKQMLPDIDSTEVTTINHNLIRMYVDLVDMVLYKIEMGEQYTMSGDMVKLAEKIKAERMKSI